MARPQAAPPTAAGGRPQFQRPKPPSLFGILGPYRKQVALLMVLAMLANVFTLFIPRLVASGIDAFTAGHFDYTDSAMKISAVTVIVLILSFCHNILQTLVAERVAKDLRSAL